VLAWIQEAVVAGASRRQACALVGVSLRTLQRWSCGELLDQRKGAAKQVPRKLSSEELELLYRTANEPRFQDMTPGEIVPTLLDEGIYLGSERTLYRLLKARSALAPRQEGRPPVRRARPSELVATGPNQVWSWDITWLKTDVAGLFKFAYVVEDVFSRRIVGWAVHHREDPELAKALFEQLIRDLGVVPRFVHADNGAAMKGITLVAFLVRVGVGLSYSRPRVSNDNPFIESLFRTLKYRLGYPKRFTSLEHARVWFAGFVHWYNSEHKHSGIQYVTPMQRHRGEDRAILARRREVLEAARARHPQRWSGPARQFEYEGSVTLNPEKKVA
jgi:transposase InsO family protein